MYEPKQIAYDTPVVYNGGEYWGLLMTLMLSLFWDFPQKTRQVA